MSKKYYELLNEKFKKRLLEIKQSGPEPSQSIETTPFIEKQTSHQPNKPKDQAPVYNPGAKPAGSSYIEPINPSANSAGYLEPLNKPVFKPVNQSGYLEPERLANDTYTGVSNNKSANNVKDSYVDGSKYKKMYVNYQDPTAISYINDDVVNELNARFSKSQVNNKVDFIDDDDEDKQSSSGYIAPRQSTAMSSTSSTAPLLSKRFDANHVSRGKIKDAPPPPTNVNGSRSPNSKFTVAKPITETDV